MPECPNDCFCYFEGLAADGIEVLGSGTADDPYVAATTVGRHIPVTAASFGALPVLDVSEAGTYGWVNDQDYPVYWTGSAWVRVLPDDKHSTRVRRTGSDQTIGTGAWTVIDFDTADHSVGTTMWTGANPSWIQLPKTAVYSVGACIEWDDSPTGERGLEIIANGLVPVVRDLQLTGSPHVPQMSVHTEVALSAGDVLETAGYQSSGAPLDCRRDGYFAPAMWCSLLVLI